LFSGAVGGLLVGALVGLLVGALVGAVARLSARVRQAGHRLLESGPITGVARATS